MVSREHRRSHNIVSTLTRQDAQLPNRYQHVQALEELLKLAFPPEDFRISSANPPK